MIDKVSKSQIPLFGYKKADYYEFLGTSILLEVDSIYLFVTANHVVRGTSDESYKINHLFFPTQPSISAFIGKISGFDNPLFDLAFGILDNESIIRLEGYEPVNLFGVIQQRSIEPNE